MAGTGLLTRSLTVRVLVLLVVSALAAAVANTISPRSIPWSQTWSDYVTRRAGEEGLAVVSLEETRSLLQAGTHLVFDARPLSDYDAGHLPSAMSLPSDEMEEQFEQYQMLLTPDQPLLVYCSGQDCDESLLLAMFFRDQGLTNVLLFADGYSVWSEAQQTGESL